ncbi:UNVERIFIED_ORG: transcriptional regulator with PAS, ATPase and Fis domain [Pseudomonas lini]|uniref:Sigma 54-interacting transcriptional regulator n=1 Tax=Pseudomonas viciae TaxID=2505979 RepID=A0ABY8P7Y8_9PSED|nr:sigma 54-interacting transcriptional regulator [Pseudomonas viciae]UZE84376.1 sigma 54-interacting transcriptional regulator [Pseudomonas viciae]WGO91292.1 sigma 54-interacting transcriptional regulator [Pseudomonas viciae]
MINILPSTQEHLPHPDQVQSLVSFLEHEPHPMIVLDPDYNILAANTAYLRQFGSADKSFIGHKCYRISHHYDVPCDQAGEHCPMKKAKEMRGPDRVLHIHHTPRGPEHVDVELRPILDEHGDITAYVERLTLVRSASARPSNEGLVGHSPAFNQALSELQRVAPSMLPVLLLGESGTGKELFARAVHETSERASGPFVVVDCSGLTETLFESELFGHEKGAFTGATTRKPGLVETAQGGTLFLDEIGDVPLTMQVKLLRLIESGTYRRVGSVETLHANFRLVAATHKPLEKMVETGEFRQDLYYRISVFPIHLPPLRNRVEDISLLVHSFLQRAGRGKRRLTIDSAALKQLQQFSWPGNIRELRNVLERASLFADDGVIHSVQLPQATAVSSPLATPVLDSRALAQVLATFKGTRSELAEHLGVSERTLYRRLKEQGLS